MIEDFNPLFGVVFLCTTFVYARLFLPWQEKRFELVRIYDVVHQSLPTIDTSIWINILENGCIFVYCCQVYQWKSLDWTRVMLSITLLFMTRMLMLLLCPFRVSTQACLLKDKVIQALIGDQVELVNDLFFSGHVSILVLLGLTTKVFPWLYFLAAFVVGICMLLSKVHYAIDVLVAPYVVFGTVSLVNYVVDTIQGN